MRSTTVVGTPQYIAPEVAAGRSAVPASDLYALGIVLYELAVGVTPFAGGSVMAVLLRHGTTLAARPEGIPDPLWELISDLLAKDPAARPADAHTTARALEALTLQLAGIPAAPRLASPLAPQPLSDVTPTDAVALPAASGSPALALPPMPPPAPEPVPETSLQPTGVLPPGPGLKAAYASISEPGESRYQSSDPTQAHGSESLSDAQPPAPAVVNGGGPPSYSMPSASGDAGTRTTLFIVVGAVLALVLTGAGVLFWYLNGSRVDPSPLQPEAVKTSAPAPSPESQSPEPPGVVPAGTTPDLKGKTEAQARALIPENVNVTVTQEMTLDFSAGEINAQEPAAGQPLGDSLKLTVESGFTDEIPEPVWLPKPAQGSWLNIGTATLHGVTHDTVIGAEVCLPGGPTTGTVVYDLAGKFSRFTATVDLVNGAGDSGDSASIEVLVDGKVYDSATLDKNSFREWDIDLTGAKKLEFNWSREHCMLDGTKVGLGSPVFTRATQ